MRRTVRADITLELTLRELIVAAREVLGLTTPIRVEIDHNRVDLDDSTVVILGIDESVETTD